MKSVKSGGVSSGKTEEDSFLTDRQARVLEMRGLGMTQREIAEELGTSVPNVSDLESRGRRNVERAEKTLELAREIEAPVRVEVDEGSDLYEVPGLVYDAADERGIDVRASGPEILRRLMEEAGEGIRDREVQRHLVITVTSDGRLSVR